MASLRTDWGGGYGERVSAPIVLFVWPLAWALCWADSRLHKSASLSLGFWGWDVSRELSTHQPAVGQGRRKQPGVRRLGERQAFRI